MIKRGRQFLHKRYRTDGKPRRCEITRVVRRQNIFYYREVLPIDNGARWTCHLDEAESVIGQWLQAPRRTPG